MIKAKQNKDHAKAAKDNHPGTKDGHSCLQKSGKNDEPSLGEEARNVKKTALPAGIS